DIHNGGDDGRTLPEGFGGQPGLFNTPSILTAAINHAQFWDGRVATLEEQVDGPLTSPTEMNSDWRRVLKYLTANPRYNEMFINFLGGEPNEERVRTALATYQRALLTVDNPFDNWLRGDESALSSDAYAGYYVFKKMNCVSCHSGEGVGGQLFQKLGSSKDYYGDHRPADKQDLGRFNVTENENDRFVFRVPSLRNVENTAPYLHDGSIETLEETVALMIEYQVGQEVNQEDVRRLTLFLKSLSGKVPDMPKMPPKPTEES
ncbi:MAG TPA: cytochrome B6, partial [Planctomycetaceae bacterium]|nr:cytochrome B6 [Planctomycetaceae bacterium]